MAATSDGEPARLRPQAGLGWTYLDTITDGTNVADRWWRGHVRVVVGTDWAPMPRGWLHHISVSEDGGAGPPNEATLASVAADFKLGQIDERRTWHSPRVVHLYARAS